jgi:hypothetical protein
MIYLQTIKKLYNIYFTNYPYNLYNYSNRVSNFALTGISYELIYARHTFWLANIGSIIFIYNIKETDFFYYHMFMLCWSLSLYGISFYKVIKVIKFI